MTASQSTLQHVKNIILDLGGVIINLDTEQTINAFNRISKIPFENLYSQGSQTALFNSFDKGEISENDFFDKVSSLIGFNGNRNELLDAWNAMLQGIPQHRLEFLKKIKTEYRTFLLSNTCEPHVAAFERDMQKNNGVSNFDGFFEKAYYSCRIGMRKPDKEIFDFVLKENNLKAGETLFIDDSEQHVNGAIDAGLHARLLPKGVEVEDYFKTCGLI
jgi:FMN phosphatase YigB (HAD superfamily)